MKLAITFQTRGGVHISRTPRRSFGGFCRCVRGGWLRRETHGFFPLIWWEEFILESALNTGMRHVVLSGRTGSCFTTMEWLLIHFQSSVLMRKDTHVYIIVVSLPQRQTPYWLAGRPRPQTFPSNMDALPFISPGVCEGVCKDSDAPCFQSCPPKSEGSMKFACKAKKWHKVTETCHTLNAMNMFEVRSFSPLSWILMRSLSEVELQMGSWGPLRGRDRLPR